MLEASGSSVRSLFISDTHIGWRYSNFLRLMDFIHRTQPSFLYLAGDIIEQKYRQTRGGKNEVGLMLERLVKLRERGVSIVRLSGNHDEVGLEEWNAALGPAVPYAIHAAVDRRSWLVVHGDIYDLHQGSKFSLASRIGGLLYPTLIRIGAVARLFRSANSGAAPHWCTGFKLRILRVRRHIRRYERYMVRLAQAHHCCGVICGHIHLPALKTIRQMTYANCGDWIEHRSYLLEKTSGEIEVCWEH